MAQYNGTCVLPLREVEGRGFGGKGRRMKRVREKEKGRDIPTHLYVNSVTWIFPGTPLLSVLLATLTVFPKRQKRGILRPTIPATTSPELIPTLIWRKGTAVSDVGLMCNNNNLND